MRLTAKRGLTWGAALLLAALAWHLLLQGGFQTLSLQLVLWQREFHRALTLAITEFSGTPSPATWMTLLGISFGYGVFHAAGPGHGKAVLTTYLLSQGGARRRALALSFAASLLQGLVAIGLVVVLVHGLGWLTRRAMGSVAWVEQASFVMVALLGLWLCLRAIRQLWRSRPAAAGNGATPGDEDHHHHPRHHHAHDHPHDHSHGHAHDHGHHCCGGHHHVEPGQASDWRTAGLTVLAIGMRPCSGAVLLLGASTLLGNFTVGVAAVLVMSLGTALTVSALALASVMARGWAERRLARHHDGGRIGRLMGWAALGGGLAIMALGVSLTVTGATQPGGLPLLGEPTARESVGEPAPPRSLFGG